MIGSQALVASYLKVGDNRHDIYTSTKGVLFFGTPHLGSDYASFHKIVLNMCKFFKNANTALVQHLIPDSEVLQLIQAQYVDISRHFIDIFFYEQYPTKVVGNLTALVWHFMIFMMAQIPTELSS